MVTSTLHVFQFIWNLWTKCRKQMSVADLGPLMSWSRISQTQRREPFFFLSKFWRTSVLFIGPLIPLLSTSGDICSVFQNKVGSPCLHALSLVCNGFLRFTSSATPVDLLAVIMAAPTYWFGKIHPPPKTQWIWKIFCRDEDVPCGPCLNPPMIGQDKDVWQRNVEQILCLLHFQPSFWDLYWMSKRTNVPKIFKKLWLPLKYLYKMIIDAIISQVVCIMSKPIS